MTDHMAQRDATETYRNPFQPQAESRPKSCWYRFALGRLWSPYFFTFFFVSDCTSVFFLGEQHDTRVLYRTALLAQPNTQTFVSSTSKGEPQPQHGIGMSSWDQNISRTFRNMSTIRSESHKLELFMCSLSHDLSRMFDKISGDGSGGVGRGGGFQKALVDSICVSFGHRSLMRSTWTTTFSSVWW